MRGSKNADQNSIDFADKDGGGVKQSQSSVDVTYGSPQRAKEQAG